jgi:hypothetical protein
MNIPNPAYPGPHPDDPVEIGFYRECREKNEWREYFLYSIRIIRSLASFALKKFPLKLIDCRKIYQCGLVKSNHDV